MVWCVVGFSDSYLGQEPFRWTSDGGMVGLGQLAGSYGRALDVSGDGSVVVGLTTGFLGQEAFYWTASVGMQSLKDMLTKDYGLDLTGWRLIEAKGISVDGLTIIGTGVNPQGDPEAWVVTIPEPATILLLGMGGLLLRRKMCK